MAVHHYFNCSKCSAQLDYPYLNSLGTTHIKCQVCNHISRSQSSPFSYKNVFGKLFVFVESLLSVKFMYLFFLVVIPTALIFGKNLFLESLISSLILSILIRVGYIINLIKKVEKRQLLIEQEYNIKPKF